VGKVRRSARAQHDSAQQEISERAALDARGHSVYHKEKDHETTYQP
jgi:hypothetical protein